jgi:hypothetical protein
MVTVNVNATFSVTNISFVYNVIASGNVRLISTSDISSRVTISDCAFSVNGSGAVVPQSFIVHYGGYITIQRSSFRNISLSSQALISFLGLFLLFLLFYVILCYVML